MYIPCEISRVVLELSISFPPTALIEFIDHEGALVTQSLNKQEYRTKVLMAGL